MSKVLAVTTSMGTKWESYSQALLAQHVPEWPRVVVDGRRNWTNTGFIDHIIDSDADYVVHVDEDCFVQSRAALLELVAYFDSNADVVAAGVPDGGHYYREHNPAALNLFFVVFRMDALRTAWATRGDWPSLRYEPSYGSEVMRQHPKLESARIQWDEAEPYYKLFWSMLARGGRFLYLANELDTQRWSTRVLAPSGTLAAEHLWYLRQWHSTDVMTGHDKPNVERYRLFLRDLLRRPESGLAFRLRVAQLRLPALARRVFGERP